MAALYLVHAAAAVILILASRLPRRARSRVTVGVAAAAAACGGLLAVLDGDPWRTTTAAGPAARAAGVAIACAWLLVAVLGPAGERWRTGALVGPATTGLALFATNRWVVPGLLFLLASSAATVALARRPAGQGAAALWIGLADAAIVAGLVAHALEAETWRLGGPFGGWPRWAVLGGAIARVGVVPRVGGWQTLRTPSAALLPLAAGGGFVAVARFVGGPLPWVGVALLAAAVVVLAWSLRSRALSAATVGAWPVSLMLAAVAINPSTSGRAAAAACLGVTLVALWPPSAGRARVPRGFGISFLPPFLGFGVVLSAAVVAFDRAAGAPTSWRSIPWTASAAILPLALAGGALLGLSAALQSRAASQEQAPALGTWIVAGAALVSGFLEPGGFLAPASVRVLYGVAIAVGLGAVYVSIALHHEDAIGPIAEGPDATHFEVGTLSLEGRLEVVARWAALVVLAGTAGVVGWLTLDGLRNGFLS